MGIEPNRPVRDRAACSSVALGPVSGPAPELVRDATAALEWALGVFGAPSSSQLRVAVGPSPIAVCSKLPLGAGQFTIGVPSRYATDEQRAYFLAQAATRCINWERRSLYGLWWVRLVVDNQAGLLYLESRGHGGYARYLAGVLGGGVPLLAARTVVRWKRPPGVLDPRRYVCTAGITRSAYAIGAALAEATDRRRVCLLAVEESWAAWSQRLTARERAAVAAVLGNSKWATREGDSPCR